MNVIREYGGKVGQVPNRGNGRLVQASNALAYGLENSFFGRVDYKLSDGTLVTVTS